MLSKYLQDLQGFVRDRGQKVLNPTDLIGYINRTRREIAERTQCVRVLTPVSGPITQIQVTAAGIGYTAPTVTITPPDQPSGTLPTPAGAQATATAQQIGGHISNISVVNGGSGYFQPQVTINDPTGTGATATAITSPINVTAYQQEVYPFSQAALGGIPGVDHVFAVKSVSIIFAQYRYSLPCYSFSTYQAQIRNYAQSFLYVPTICAQYGQGANGSLYLYPIASQPYQLEFDCFCVPSDLKTDQDYEAIPSPWTDAVAMGAAVYAYEEMQAFNNARYWYEKFETYVHKYSQYARPGRIINPYGNYAWWAAIILPILSSVLGVGMLS